MKAERWVGANQKQKTLRSCLDLPAQKSAAQRAKARVEFDLALVLSVPDRPQLGPGDSVRA